MKNVKTAVWKSSLTMAVVATSFGLFGLGDAAHATEVVAPTSSTRNVAVTAFDAMNALSTNEATCYRHYYRRIYYRRVYYRRPRHVRYLGSRIMRYRGRLYRVRYYRRTRY